MQTEIWAHRGASKKYIENTMSAFQQAYDDGAEGIEIDVQRTRDNKLVVYHDENLKRLTGLNKFIWEIEWQELKGLELHALNEDDTNIPTLKEVLDFVKQTDMTLNIELKNSLYFYPGLEEDVLDMVKEMDMLDQVLFSSFNHESMKKMSGLVGPDKCAILTSDILVDPVSYAKKVGVEAIHPMINAFQQNNFIGDCKNQGLSVNVWTADDDAHIYAALLFAVDAIITNEPEKAVHLREQFLSDGGKKAVEAVRAYGRFNME